MTPLYQKVLSEFLGTLMLVLTAVGAAVAGEGLLGQALANGIVVSVIVAAYAGIGNAHFNPAVTVAFTFMGRCELKRALGYVVAQVAAATLAAAAVAYFYADMGSSPADALESQAPVTVSERLAPGAALPSRPDTPVTKILAGEALITALLMIAIYGTMIDPRGSRQLDGDGDSPVTAKIGGFGVGFAVAANILALGPVTGASMNPARSLGPALVRGDFGLHWCYWVGPTIGAVLGALIYERLMLAPAADPDP